MPNILDPKFKYVPAAQTDIAQTFKRIRREQAEAKKLQEAQDAERILKVRTIGGKR